MKGTTRSIPMTREQFTAKEAEAKAHGFTVTTDQGTLKIPTPLGEVTMSYSYSDFKKMLDVTTVHKPFLLTEGFIEKKENQFL